MKKRFIRKVFFLLSLCISAGQLALAQPFTMQPDIVPTELNLYPYKPAGKPAQEGRMNVTQVTQVKDTLYFFAKGFSSYAPMYVGVTSGDKTNDLDVGIFTENWTTAVQHGNTGSEGHWEKSMKREGDFGIRIIAKTKPANYTIVVWNGKDVEVKMPTAFSYNSNPGGGGGGFFKKYWIYLAGGAVILILLLLLLLKRKKS